YDQQVHIKNIDIPPLINEIQYFLQNHYKENISLDFLSEQFHISKFHLSREFKKYINLSPYEFLINTRIDKSKQLLLSTNLTISEISKQVGISDPNNFLYIFKNREHISPSQFKKKFTYNKKEINPLKKMSDKKD
ncbi:MAG: AraC family transcriptional regulator, partial [Clostridioides sp.]|nr:AraC family transcriptional regulator [Clostridioides sp.]